MQKELEELQPQLVISAEENSKMMVIIEKESGEVEATSKIVKADEAVANVQAAEAQALKDECEAELAEAIPALEAALAALDTLKVLNLLCHMVFLLKSENTWFGKFNFQYLSLSQCLLIVSPIFICILKKISEKYVYR